jgi:hypothetical protein
LAFQAFTQQPIHSPLGRALKLRRCQDRNITKRIFILSNAVENPGSDAR